MNHSALRLRSRYQSSLRSHFCDIHVQRLSSAGSVPVANSDQQALETLEPWQHSDGKTLARNEQDAKDIVVNDLSATLEAHRASNRAVVIRKLNSNPPIGLPFKRLSPEEGSGRGSEVKKTHKEKKSKEKKSKPDLRQTWPADSVQAKEIYGRIGTKGKTGTTGFVKKAGTLEYTGAEAPRKAPWGLSRRSKEKQMDRPWLQYIKTTGDDKPERYDLGSRQGCCDMDQNLTNEIKAYEAYMRLSPREEAASELVISDVNSVARYESNLKPLTLLGSRSTGLATPISDFDFSLTQPISRPGGWTIPPRKDSVSQPHVSNSETRLKAVKALRKVNRHFHSSKKFSNTELIRFARVPIIRSTHIATGLDVQIQTRVSLKASDQYTIAYLSEFPSLRPLYIILRYCLKIRDLTTVFEGGLGSYPLLMMIVTALKHSSGKFASGDLGGQLLHVLEFYGDADLYEVGFSANPPCIFDKQKKTRSLGERIQSSGINLVQTFHPQKPYLLCLQDPADDTNDLGRNTYAIKHIQATFRRLKESIQRDLRSEDNFSNGKPRARIGSYLDCLVRADYRHFEERRCRVERFAVPQSQKIRTTPYKDQWRLQEAGELGQGSSEKGRQNLLSQT